MHGTRKDDQYKKTGIIGDNGTGKSTMLLNLMGQCYDLKNHRVLILCGTTPKAYKNITRIETYEDLKKFRNGIALFWDYEVDEITMLVKLIAIYQEGQQNFKKHPQQYDLHYLHNGALVFEDASNYLETTLPKVIKAFLGNYRMYFIDLFFIAHTFTDFPSGLRRRMNYFIVYTTLEELSEKDFKSFRYPNYTALHQAWQKKRNDPDRFTPITITTGAWQILKFYNLPPAKWLK